MLIDLPNGRKAELTMHAVERFVERVRPLELDQAAAEIQRLVSTFGEVLHEAPAWHRTSDDLELVRETFGWVACGDLLFVIANHQRRPGWLSITTVICRGHLASRHLRDRRRRRHEERTGTSSYRQKPRTGHRGGTKNTATYDRAKRQRGRAPRSDEWAG